MSEKKSTPAHLGEQKAPDITNIRYNDYTRTLLAEGIRIGALKHSDAEKMSSALLTVLTELLAEYLEREGITDELEFGAAAAELMQSLIFTIDTYLISLSDSALAMRQLKGVKDENVREMRRGGMAALRVLQCEALSLHAKAKSWCRRSRLPLCAMRSAAVTQWSSATTANLCLRRRRTSPAIRLRYRSGFPAA